MFGNGLGEGNASSTPTPTVDGAQPPAGTTSAVTDYVRGIEERHAAEIADRDQQIASLQEQGRIGADSINLVNGLLADQRYATVLDNYLNDRDPFSGIGAQSQPQRQQAPTPPTQNQQQTQQPAQPQPNPTTNTDDVQRVVQKSIAEYHQKLMGELKPHQDQITTMAASTAINQFLGADPDLRTMKQENLKPTVDLFNKANGALTMDQAFGVVAREKLQERLMESARQQGANQALLGGVIEPDGSDASAAVEAMTAQDKAIADAPNLNSAISAALAQSMQEAAGTF